MTMKILKYLSAVAAFMASAASCVFGPDYAPSSELASLAINEICPASSDSESGWVEIVNTSSSTVNVSGLKLLVSDDFYYRKSIFEAPETLSIEAGEKYVISAETLPIKAETLEELVLTTGKDTVVLEMNVKSLSKEIGLPEQNGSWSRIPDITGDFIVTETATKGEKNYKYVPYKIDGLVINEVCPSEGWIELINDTFSTLTLTETRIVAKDNSGKEHDVYQFESGEVKLGERFVIEAPLDDMKELRLVSNEKKVVDSLIVSDIKDQGKIASGKSFSRLPDLDGEWYISSTLTKNAKNQDSSSDITHLVLNEISLADGWIEVYNPTVRTLNVAGATISVDGKTAGTLTSSISPDGRQTIAAVVKAGSEVILKASDGKTVDVFKQSLVNDTDIPSVKGSWSRIPDGSDWYTVKTSSKDKFNYGIIKGNTIGIWYNQSNTPKLMDNLDLFAQKGIGHVFLHEYAFKYYEDLIPAIFAKAEEIGITMHIWMQCFWWNDNKGVNGWRSPVIDSLKCYDQALFDDILGEERAAKYVKAGAKGIHFDYIRYGGTAYKHDYPEVGVTGVGSIDEFLRQADVKLRGINPNLILSAALMAEQGSERAYGQHPESMGKVLDILIPMIYRHSGGYNIPTAVGKANYFATHGAPAQCWAGTQTYDANSYGLSADVIKSDCEGYLNSQASGVVLFRHGIGDIPNMLDIKFKK